MPKRKLSNFLIGFLSLVSFMSIEGIVEAKSRTIMLADRRVVGGGATVVSYGEPAVMTHTNQYSSNKFWQYGGYWGASGTWQAGEYWFPKDIRIDTLENRNYSHSRFGGSTYFEGYRRNANSNFKAYVSSDNSTWRQVWDAGNVNASSPINRNGNFNSSALGTFRYVRGKFDNWNANGDNSATIDAFMLSVSETDNEAPYGNAPTIVSETSTGYTVRVTGVGDAISGVSMVRFPTWTEANGQDDIKWYAGTNKGNGVWECTINKNQHNNETGKYITHVYAYDADWAGNSKNLGEAVSIVDSTPPSINITGNPTSWTNNNITLNVTATDTESGVNYITKPDGSTVASTSTSYTVTANGTYTFKAVDKRGNESTQSVTVSKIDKAAPTISISGNPTSWTNSNVTLNVTASDTGGSGVKEIVIPSGQVISGSSLSYSLSSNGTCQFKVRDNAGNETTYSVVVDKIDKTAPTLALEVSPTSWTNKDVTVNCSIGENQSGIAVKKYASGSQSASYFASSGTNISGTSFNVPVNGIYTVYVKDAVGNETIRTIAVNNIDKAAPTISLSQDASMTNSNVTINTVIESGSATGSGKSPIVIKKYASGSQSKSYFASGGTVFTGTSFSVASNGVYTVYAKDEAGNETVVAITVNNIDKTPPSITGTLDYPWVKGSQDVNLIATDSQTKVSSFKIWNSTKTTVIKSGIESGNNMVINHTFTNEGQTIYKVEAIDSVSNVVTRDLIIRIDNTAPTAKVTMPSETLSRVININLSNIVDSHSGIKECIISESPTFDSNVKRQSISGNSATVSYTLLKETNASSNYGKRNVYVKVIDNVGNFTVYDVSTILKPLPPEGVTIKTPGNDQLFVNGESVVVSWTYDSASNEFDLPQKRAIITLHNLDNKETYTYVNDSSSTSYIIGGLVAGRYQVTVEVVIDIENKISTVSGIRNFRYNYFKDNGLVYTKIIDAGNKIRQVLVVTGNEIPVGTTIEGKIYYEMINSTTFDMNKYIAFELNSDFDIKNMIRLPKDVSKLQIEYRLKNTSSNKMLSPVLDYIEVYGY